VILQIDTKDAAVERTMLCARCLRIKECYRSAVLTTRLRANMNH